MSAAASPLRTVTLIFIFLLAILTMITGCIHLHYKLDSRWCPKNEHERRHSNIDDCIGKSLAWADTKHSVDDINQNWRTVFTFVPGALADNWTPFIMGLMTLLAFFFERTHIKFIASTWARAFLWHLVVALWGNFGYAGNFGICIGFINSFVSLLCLINAFMSSEGPFENLGKHLPMEKLN
eukprot:Sspe_Gene.90052::Locus_61683_Transcript_1_1_Confidence_1.000_Length_779::g.90052::m.90052